MPRIPQAERRVEQQGLPGPRFSASATPESFGATEARRIGEIGRGLSQAAVIAGERQREEQNLTDKSLVRDELNAARSEIREYMGSVYGSKGKDAINSYAEVDRTLEDIRKKRIQNLQSAEQKDLFTTSYDSFSEAHKNRAITFQTNARKEYEKTTIDAENQNAIDDAVAAYTDPNEVKNAEDTIIANVRYTTKPFGAEVTKQAVTQAVDTLYSNIIASIGKDDPENALAFFQKNKDKFEPEKRTALEKTLKEKAKEANAKKTAIDISTSGLPFDEQLEQVNKIKDPEKAKLVNTLVTDRQKLKVAIEEAKLKADYETERDKVMQDPIGYIVPIELPGDEQEHLYKLKKSMMQDKLAEQGIGAKVQTDWDVYYALQQEYANAPQAFGDKDLMPFFPKLAASEKKELIKLQQESRQGVFDTELQNQTQYVNGIIKAAGIDEKADPKSLRQANFIRRLFERTLKTFPEEERNTLKVWNQISDGIFLQTDVTRTFIDMPLWKAMYGKRKIVEPDPKPSQIPKSAKWKQFDYEGIRYTGWLHFDPETAVTYLYTLDGRTHTVKGMESYVWEKKNSRT